MLKRFQSIWKPGAYHGKSVRDFFFEGWYLKLISNDVNERWAIIPGVFNHPDPAQRHAFIQVLDGMSNDVIYHRFSIEFFHASRSDFSVRINDNYFHSAGCVLNIDSQGQKILGELKFEEIKPWPIKLFSPGVMGPYGLIPFMQTYHGILSLNHGIQGNLVVNGQSLDFSNGRGYIEKDWGSTFPRAYIWMQSNHFPEKEISLTASVATIPWLGSWFRGFLIGILINGKLYRFATYLGSIIHSLSVTDNYVTWSVLGNSRSGPIKEYPRYQLNIQAERGNGGLLLSPELDGMTPRILESLTANITVELNALDKEGFVRKTIYQGTGICAGLEVAGSIEELVNTNLEEDQG